VGSLLNAAPSVFEPAAGDLGGSLLNGSAPLAAPPTKADAFGANSKAYNDWVAKERADGVAKGLLDPETGWATKAGLEEASRQLAQSILMGSTAPGEAPGFTAYHGSAHSFDRLQPVQPFAASQGALYSDARCRPHCLPKSHRFFSNSRDRACLALGALMHGQYLALSM
jgi:hypothetical protein